MDTFARSELPFWQRHWFFIAVALVLIGDGLTFVDHDLSTAGWLEIIWIIDLVLVIPLLYWCCYRQLRKAAVLKAIALSCAGIWLAGYFVPKEQHNLLNELVVVRYLGGIVLVLFEIKLVAQIYRAAFSGLAATTESARQAEDLGMPAWVVRLLLWEASLWRRVWSCLKRFGRRQ